ncbi:hypothetical protein AVEN_179079-1, partial [Araneus ventricosus]
DNKEFPEDTDFGSVPEQENQTAVNLDTENIKRKIDENDFRQVKTFDKSDPLHIEEDFPQSRCREYKSCDSSTLEDYIFSADMRMNKDSEDKSAENSETKCEAMDATETFRNENGVTNDEPNVAVG